MSEPTQLRQKLVCPDCAQSFEHIPRTPAHYVCPRCAVKWSWGLGFGDKKPEESGDGGVV